MAETLNLVWWDRETDPRALSRQGHEVWVAIGQYAVSNLGRGMSVRQRKTGRLLKSSVLRSGYRIFNFRGENQSPDLVHRAVVTAFDGPPPTDQHTDVRHLDGDASNNVLHNLLWGTRSENMLDVVEHRKQQRAQQRETQIEEAKREARWHGGRTWDTELVTLLLTMEAERRITIKDLARILDVPRHTAHNLVHGHCQKAVERPARLRAKRRSPAQKAVIVALVQEGLNADAINAKLGETLTPQDVYYYRLKAQRDEQRGARDSELHSPGSGDAP
jgi:hypothetical protein